MRKFLTLTAAAALAVAFGYGGAAQAGSVTFPFDDSLVGYWSFDDNTDPTNDDSANSNTGDLKPGGGNQPTFDGGELAPIATNVKSLEFDGVTGGSPPTGGFVEVAGEATFDFERTNSFTIAAWVKLSNSELGAADRFVFAKQRNSSPFRGYVILVCKTVAGCPDGSLLGGLEGDSTELVAAFGGTNVADDSFHHVAMVWDGSCDSPPDVDCMTLFVDGVAETLTTFQDNLASTILHDKPLTIGSRDGGGVPFVGNIDDARIYNRALTADEILQLATGISIEKELVSTDEVTGGNTNADNVLQQGEEWEFTMKVTVTNNSSEDFSDVVIRDPLPGDLEIGDGTSDTGSACLKDIQPLTPAENSNLDPTVGSVATKDKGRTDKCILDWTIGDFDSGDSEMLTIIASTDENPGGGKNAPHQEFTSSGPYCINQGAKFTGERDSDEAIIIIRSNGLLVPNLATLSGTDLDHDVVSHDACDAGS